MAIVAPAAFESEAADYARFRSEESLKKVRCAGVRAEDLYALHDGGRASPVALRDWLRKAKEDMPSLKSVLLLGDAHFDYLGNSGIEPMLLPSFEHQFLLTDDYFGALDAGESVSVAASAARRKHSIPTRRAFRSKTASARSAASSLCAIRRESRSWLLVRG